MSNNDTVYLLFAGTTDYLPMATVTALSANDNLNKNYKLKIYYLYADIVKDITEKERNNIFEYARETLDNNNIQYEFIDISSKVCLLEGQNIGMWGKKISLTHYFYLLAPEFIKDINKIIYIDTDIIVNCDLSEVYNLDIKDCLLAMGRPRGYEEMGDNVCNAGFVILNIEKWQQENTLYDLLQFGKQLPKSNFCAQNLLHQYFTLKNNNRLYLLDKEYNIFPQLFWTIPLNNIKILHFTGYKSIKPWYDVDGKQRAGFLWWKYAKMSSFYEQFLLKASCKLLSDKSKNKNTFLQTIFSIKNSNEQKIITIMGIKIKIKRSVKCKF